MIDTLAGISILVTRPLHQTQTLRDKIESLGGSVIALPTVTIHPLAIDQTILKKNIQKQDMAIFLSANAVTHSLTLWQSLNELPEIIAIGPGTAKTLSDANLPVDRIPSHYSSEGLLDLLSNATGKTIYLCCGDNSRSLLTETLSQNNTIVPIISYYRKPVTINKVIKKLLQQEPIDWMVTTSQALLSAWHQLIVDADMTTLLKKPLLVVDKKHEHLAKQLGFNRIIVAKNPQPDAIVNAITNHILGR